MTLIIPNQDFKHNGQDFLKDKQYEVSEMDAEYFKAAGWVGHLKEPAQHALKVDDLRLGTISNVP